jgi:hypothetical protein
MDIKHFNWLPRPSAWQESESWRARRQAMVQETLDTSDTFTSLFATAASNQIQGSAKLAAQAAIKRIQTSTKAKLDQALLKLDASLGTTDKSKIGSSKTSSSTTGTKVDKKV